MKFKRKHGSIIALAYLVAYCASSDLGAESRDGRPSGVVATFSIVACDLEACEWGVATQSRVLAVGSIVPFAKAEVGAIATQSQANTSFGPRGLQMLSGGSSAQVVLDALLADDEQRESRQAAIVDREGRVAHFTGSDCLDWAGAEAGEHYCCLGNILAGEQVVQDMAKAFEEAEGRLADRMWAALRTGQAAGGDKRGRQSAAIYVVKEKGGYAGFNDRYVDLRVDDHPRPIEELGRLLDLRFRRSRPEPEPEAEAENDAENKAEPENDE